MKLFLGLISVFLFPINAYFGYQGSLVSALCAVLNLVIAIDCLCLRSDQ